MGEPRLTRHDGGRAGPVLAATHSRAITAMLSQSMTVMMTVQAMGQTMRVRSGLGEGLDVATRLRKPADPMDQRTPWSCMTGSPKK